MLSLKNKGQYMVYSLLENSGPITDAERALWGWGPQGAASSQATDCSPEWDDFAYRTEHSLLKCSFIPSYISKDVCHCPVSKGRGHSNRGKSMCKEAEIPKLLFHQQKIRPSAGIWSMLSALSFPSPKSVESFKALSAFDKKFQSKDEQ